MSFDLMIQSRRSLSAAQRDALVQELEGDPELSVCEVSVSATDDEFDVDELEEYLDEEPRKRAQFEAFCKQSGLNPTSSRAATEFLSREFGYTHAVITLPADEAEATRAFAALLQVAARHSVVVHDPQVGRDVPADHANPLPPGWG